VDERAMRETAGQIAAQAKAVDIGLTTLMNDARKRGMDVGVIASGALFAVVRFHVEHMSPPITVRHVIALMAPNIQAIAETLTAPPNEKPN